MRRDGERIQPWDVGAGALVLGGVAAAGMPQHAMSVIQLVAVTVAVSAGLYVFGVHVPASGWISPFRWLSPFSPDAHRGPPAHRSLELELLRGKLRQRRQPLEGATPLPPSLLRVLKPLIAAALDIDPMDPHELGSARPRLSPESYAVLISKPLKRPTWLRTMRPDEPSVAREVHRILDELDRLQGRPELEPTSPTSGPDRSL